MNSHPVSDRAVDIESSLLSIHEALEVLGGKWKVPILLSLSCGRKRFSELREMLKGLSSKILSKELRQLEEHHLVTRVLDEVTNVHYYTVNRRDAPAIERLIDVLREWGDDHRSKIFSRTIHTTSITQFVRGTKSSELILTPREKKCS
jgi:DNA-binding HxlR family transcriptional regulator